jgi:hypothetical protein
MVLEELVALVKDYEDAILSQEMTATEVTAFLGMLQARLYRRLFSMSSAPVAPKVKIPRKAEPVEETGEDAIPSAPPTPPKPKSIHYDPLYDPPPPFDPDPLPPPQEAATGAVVAVANSACICVSCNKVGYITNADIRDNMKIVDFLAAFTPSPGMPALTRSLEIQNIDGNISIDCPSCKQSKSLYLVGRKTNA